MNTMNVILSIILILIIALTSVKYFVNKTPYPTKAQLQERAKIIESYYCNEPVVGLRSLNDNCTGNNNVAYGTYAGMNDIYIGNLHVWSKKSGSSTTPRKTINAEDDKLIQNVDYRFKVSNDNSSGSYNVNYEYPE